MTRHFLMVCLVWHCLTAPAPGQPAAVTGSSPGLPEAGTNLLTLPPTPPLMRSPVDVFRELLASRGQERTRLLEDRPAETRTRILTKIHEYEALQPDERELRLQATELRFYLRPMMNLPPGGRSEALKVIPAEKRALVESRLQEWDQLPEPARRELLDNEAAITYFTEVQSASEEQKRRMLESMSPARREKLESGMASWGQMAETQRKSILNRFNHFFELTTGEKQRALATLSEQERHQIEKTLLTFGSLPAGQRAECIRSFDKFASLSTGERELFLKNAEKWKVLTPEQRQAWRTLVAKLNQHPPLPPDVPLPPLPGAKKKETPKAP